MKTVQIWEAKMKRIYLRNHQKNHKINQKINQKARKFLLKMLNLFPRMKQAKVKVRLNQLMKIKAEARFKIVIKKAIIAKTNCKKKLLKI